MSNTYSEFVFLALGIQDVMSMRHIIICGMPLRQHFSIVPHTWHDFREKPLIEHKISVLVFSTTFV